jgi:peptidyl-prolyl cis-trans isomerase D
MIKLMREAAHNYPWLLKSIMGLLAIAFIITMGWWGFEQQEPNAVASVGSLDITREEFQRSYENLYRFYKEKLPGDFKDETLKELVLERLIETKLWLLAAEQMGLQVTPAELHDDIVQRPDFQQNGKFDPDYYRRVLAANRLTPALFESLHTTELLGDKARMVILDSVALTPAEMKEADTLMARQSQPENPSGPSARDRIKLDFLQQKQQRAMMAFQDSLRATIPIKVRKELL